MDLTHSDLVDLGRRWLLNYRHCPVVATEIVCGMEIPDVVGWSACGSTFIECKVSASDLKRDRHKVARRVPDYAAGMQRYYLVTEELESRVMEVAPPDWGILVAKSLKRYPKVARASAVFQADRTREIATLISILRRMHRVGDRLEGVNVKVYDFVPNHKPRATLTVKPEENE